MVIIAITSRRHAPTVLLRAEKNIIKLGAIYIYMLLKVPRWSSASQMFVSAGVPTCAAVMHNVMYRCMCRLSESLNSIILTLTNSTLSSVRLFSNMWNHWRLCNYVILWILSLCVYLYVVVVSLFGPSVSFNKVLIDLYIQYIREIYFHLNNNLRKRKKNCATSSLCRVSVHFCAARKETRRQKRHPIFLGLFYKSANICFYCECTQIKANLLQFRLSS